MSAINVSTMSASILTGRQKSSKDLDLKLHSVLSSRFSGIGVIINKSDYICTNTFEYKGNN